MLPELSADVARSDPKLGQLHNPQPDMVGQRPAVDENSPQLVDLAVRVDVGLWDRTVFNQSNLGWTGHLRLQDTVTVC